METQEALTRFIKKCEERGLTDNTRRTYLTFLRHFVDEYPELPTDNKSIEDYLKKRKETPAHRGTVFKKLQAFYSYLEEFEGISSPVPRRAPMGRPPKAKLVTNPASAEPYDYSTLDFKKVVQGGFLRFRGNRIRIGPLSAELNNREIARVNIIIYLY